MEFRKLPLEERLKWLIYTEEEGKKRKKELDQAQEQARLQKMKAKAKKSTTNPGVRRK